MGSGAQPSDVIELQVRGKGTVALAPTARGWLATYAVDHGTLQAEWVRCRSEAPLGPPSAIAPAGQ